MNIPNTMKEVVPFVNKGKELENSDKYISYYCYYYAMEVILEKNLHKNDALSTGYALELMNLLETKKNEIGDDRILSDSTAAETYIQEFAQKLLDEADAEVANGVASIKTASLFKSAATIFQISQVNGKKESVAEKVKYCKYHALKVVKARNEPRAPLKAEQPLPHDEPEVRENVEPAPPTPAIPKQTPFKQPQNTNHEQLFEEHVGMVTTIAEIQKHARFAISSLEFSDFKTAKKELESALEALNKLDT